MPTLRPWILMMLAVGQWIGTRTTEGAKPEVHFVQEPGKIRISIGGAPFGTYVYRDPLIPRPYFVDVHAPGRVRATRNHPPIPGMDLTDHDRLHPGIWLAFGDLDGGDFWRNKARIEHVDFLDVPRGEVGRGSFAVNNRYVDGDRTVCDEIARYSIVICSEGWLLTIASEFFSKDHDFAFGDQEEMGLGLRVVTPIAVKQGGKILNSDGLVNEAQAWGKQADWCLYGGNVGEQHLSIVLIPDPRNVRRSWFHARDYGFIAANPFGRNAFTKGDKSRIVVKKGDVFRLGYGVFLAVTKKDQPVDGAKAQSDYLREIGAIAENGESAREY